MADRTGNHKGDPVGAPLAGAHNNPMADRTGDHKGDRKGRPYRRVPPVTPMADRNPLMAKSGRGRRPWATQREGATAETEFLGETRFLEPPLPADAWQF
jgi:hypothetical protein